LFGTRKICVDFMNKIIHLKTVIQRKLALLCFLFFFFSTKCFLQAVGISEVAITPDASCILELNSTTKGLLITRMTEAERDAIGSPAQGLIIYNTTSNLFNFYNGTTWLALITANNIVNNISGTNNRITINGTNSNPVIDIASNYSGQNSINTLGTITTGTWNGSLISSAFGGTGNGFTKFSGPTTSEKTFTLPNASATILTTNSAVTAAQGGTGFSSYAVGDILFANTTNTLSKLAGVATGNALISGGVSTAPSWGKINLTSHISGVLSIANGGTNTSTALNNNRIMVSSSGAIREATALTNGQLLIGSTNAAPVAANLTEGNGIKITNSAGGITIANEPTITQVSLSSPTTTTSTTDVLLNGMSITPGAGDYMVFFTGNLTNTNDRKQGTISLYKNGIKITDSEISTEGFQKESIIPVSITRYITGVNAGEAIDVRWNVTSNTGTFYSRTLIVQKVK